MSLTIEFTPTEETSLRTAAEREGTDVASFIREKLFAVREPVTTNASTLTAFLQATGNAATRTARENLHAQGISYVVSQDNGAIVEKQPNGATHVLQAPGTIAP